MKAWRCPECGEQVSERDTGFADGRPDVRYVHLRAATYIDGEERYSVPAEEVEVIPVSAFKERLEDDAHHADQARSGHEAHGEGVAAEYMAGKAAGLRAALSVLIKGEWEQV